jgi:histone H3/H4
MNDWSFSQLCRWAGVSKDTVNRVSSDTASRIFAETLPQGGNKPLQLYTEGDLLRSIHGTSYTRVHDVELVSILQEFAVDFQPPQKGLNGATGLYCGEQDMFCFLIDPTGWTEIEGEAFAPGFFLWNSEVGRRSLGIQTFWFQAVCRNHIVWDAIEVANFSRKHTANVHESLGDVRRIIEGLVAKRDERRDGFVKVIAKAMTEKLGQDAADTFKALIKNGIPQGIAKQALKIAEQQGRFTIFALVDALTRIAGEITLAGDRTEADIKASALLALAA